MDNIDITDSTFSLNMPYSSNNLDIDNNIINHNFFFILAGLSFVGLLIYKYFQTKNNENYENLDCEGGFCTMKPNNTTHSSQEE